MKKWYIKVERELEEPAVFHVETFEKPTGDEIKTMFRAHGYHDDWNFIGRITCKEVFHD